MVDIHGFQLALMNNPKIEIIKEYKSVFKGFLVEAEKADLIPFIGHPMVKAISANALEKEDDVSWALDRIDQESLPLDNSFLPPTHGNGVNIYILDSGIRSNHTEFSGRIAQGQDFTGDGNTHDCSGHGTGVAALAAGSTLGVASQASIIPIKVTPCGGGRTSSMIVNGLDWILDNFQYPGVVNLSFASSSVAVSMATDSLISAGIPVVASAGNNSTDACTQIPANVYGVITVGATTSTDSLASFSNYGQCVDIFGPGVHVTTASISGGSSSIQLMSGTSVSAPLVAGGVALLIENDAYMNGLEIVRFYNSFSTKDKISGLDPNSPNRFLNVSVTLEGGTNLLVADQYCDEVNFYITTTGLNGSIYELYMAENVNSASWLIESSTSNEFTFYFGQGEGRYFKARACNSNTCSSFSQPTWVENNYEPYSCR